MNLSKLYTRQLHFLNHSQLSNQTGACATCFMSYFSASRK